MNGNVSPRFINPCKGYPGHPRYSSVINFSRLQNFSHSRYCVAGVPSWYGGPDADGQPKPRSIYQFGVWIPVIPSLIDFKVHVFLVLLDVLQFFLPLGPVVASQLRSVLRSRFQLRTMLTAFLTSFLGESFSRISEAQLCLNIMCACASIHI